MKSVAVLGAGPSGLMAAWAADRLGYEVFIYDIDPQAPTSKSAGVYYLHAPCGLDEMLKPEFVEVSGVGNAKDYALKLYGKGYQGPTSFPTQTRMDLAYNGKTAMDWLWNVYGPDIQRYVVRSQSDIEDMAEYGANYVVCTVPMDAWFQGNLPFRKAWIATDDEFDTSLFDRRSFMRYNGRPMADWYRESFIFGRYTLEYVPEHDPRDSFIFRNTNVRAKLHQVRKVYWDEAVERPKLDPRTLLTGRYGRWDKRILTHNVFDHVSTWLQLGRDNYACA